MINRERLANQLIDDEALRTKLYRCSEGYLTIGVGRNLDTKGISRAEALYLLDNDITDALADCRAAVVGFDDLDPVRQEVLANMALNLGRDRFLGFRKMRAAVAAREFETAAVEMLNSKWAQQVKGRADRLAYAMRFGRFNQ
jgi:lysozyme